MIFFKLNIKKVALYIIVGCGMLQMTFAQQKYPAKIDSLTALLSKSKPDSSQNDTAEANRLGVS